MWYWQHLVWTAAALLHLRLLGSFVQLEWLLLIGLGLQSYGTAGVLGPVAVAAELRIAVVMAAAGTAGLLVAGVMAAFGIAGVLVEGVMASVVTAGLLVAVGTADVLCPVAVAAAGTAELLDEGC